MNPQEAFGIVLKRVRNDAGLTQEDLAYQADLNRVFIARLETGDQQPTITTILAVSRALGVSAAELVGQVESELND